MSAQLTEQEIEDRLAIMEMVAQYSHAWDNGDTDAYAALYTEDGIFELNPQRAGGPDRFFEGRDAIHEWAGGSQGAQREQGTRVRHNQTGTVFEELTADSARTRTMLVSTRLEGDATRPRPGSSGVYMDEWRRTAEGWRIARRTLRHDGVV